MLNQKDSNQLKEHVANFITSANLPFRLVENGQLKILCQFLISLGAKYSNINVENIWYGRHTIRDFIVSTCQNTKEEISLKIREASHNSSLSIATDIWTDSVNRDSFLDVSAHWIDNFTHKNACIAFK